MAGSPDAEPTAVMAMTPESPPGSHTQLSPSPPSLHGSTTSVGSPLEALERDEIMRTRRFCYITVVLAVLAAFAVLVTPGDTTAKRFVLVATAIGIASMGFVLYRTRDPSRYRQASTSFVWFVPAACVNAAVLFFGAFSPAPMVLVLGLYFLGLGKSASAALLGYIVCALFQGVLATLVITGTVRDPGVVQVPSLGMTEQIIVQVLVQLVLATTIVTARMSRRTALLAVGELEQAVRVATQRQALLLEAREQLERALKSGRGRFSDQVIGTYQLGVVLGRGAMGEVYEAIDETGGVFAVKLLSSTSLGNPDHVMRFLRELRTAAGIVSPNVVRVIDVGDHPVPYLVMERLEGATLGDILRTKRTMSPDNVVELIAQIANGITAAAAAGVVHRDLKPQNVFDHHGTWKLLDFGVARGSDHGDTLTAGQIVGTPSYMAPEQASGGRVDHRTDLYAVTAIAYRALTGQPPFAAGEIAETLYRVVNTRPPRPTLIAPELPPEIDLVLAIGMAARPEDRFATAGELASALADAVTGRLSPAIAARGATLVRAGGWSSALPPRKVRARTSA